MLSLFSPWCSKYVGIFLSGGRSFARCFSSALMFFGNDMLGFPETHDEEDLGSSE